MSDIPTGGLLTILFSLIFFSAFFSGSETALMMLNRYRLKHLAESGHLGAQRAQTLLETPERLIGLILLGNNFVNIMASALATLVALRIGGEPAIAISTGLLTLIVLIYAEVIPKTFAALHPELIAFPAAHVYTVLLKLAWPIVWLINRITYLHLRLLGITNKDAANNALNSEELRTVVNEAGAMLPQENRNMLIGVLDLDKITAEDIMIPRNEISGIDLSDNIDEITEFLRGTHFTRILVFDGSIDNIVGFIHTRRCMQMMMRDELTKENLRAHIKQPYYVPEGTSLNRLMNNFQRDRRKNGLVVDEYGDVQGLVTFANLIEEIIGEFTTDPTTSISDVSRQNDGSYLVNGSANLRDLVRTMHWNLPTDGPKTINGLIIEHLESIPEPNTSLLLAGYPIEILQTEDNMVKVLRIQPDLYRN
ncbi:HlyC/CorC family transporter [Solemya velum gill symbiont]|uniref:Magnesium/cobalt efflux protein n=1 Tax=Solemya velum gill symbiont TaxID=2340 RepID=A0A0B0H6W4_SOVGS|nr:HlyC/CorC family transporter [Solemya velum gill symbiont]KHF24840.1 putative Mg2+ and Co2+ transporter CorB [Solemya velum gill symbiont]OOY35059.1 magnesium/cobalt efflux protein [Solemya velum gill symbiont]OOY37761.1 magnesium/cobalt efflux protein [Solemya velum gill symbiont]OOY40576.1 magnesium/cobalt efflux protein [Solemya velum gill symbiont]OOY42640.1 magnesium/cobalt efflux protein [Solemya velum gill symbiont]